MKDRPLNAKSSIIDYQKHVREACVYSIFPSPEGCYRGVVSMHALHKGDETGSYLRFTRW